MKLKGITRDGIVPQIELGPRLGGMKILFQRSGIVARMITMTSAMGAVWSTTPFLREVFLHSFVVFFAAAAGILLCWMAFDYTVIYPSEQSFVNGQSERTERSPVKQDTEAIRQQIQDLERRLDARADGGEE